MSFVVRFVYYDWLVVIAYCLLCCMSGMPIVV